jgi:glycosyltransferase involved in cell wall biosynthesis
MRVLWFTNVPLLPVTHRIGIPDPVSGGWMGSLRFALQSCPDLELGVASVSEIEDEMFEEDGTQFYRIDNPAKHGNLASIYRRWFPRTEAASGLRKCLGIIERFKPDLIHIHGTEDYYGILARETTIPTVISIQGILSICELFYFGGFSCRDKLHDVFSWEFLRGIDVLHQHSHMKKKALRERQILANCKYFIGRTEFDRNFVALLNPDSSYFHCDEILRSPFYSGEWNPESKNKSIIFCNSSGPAPYKGLDCLFHACTILKSNGIGNIELRIAGPIQNSPTWRILRKKLTDLNLIRDVVWLGLCSSEIIVSELEKANAFVLPSYVENSPNSLAEAMLIGTPCIASNVGGIPSLLTHNRDGLLFPCGDAYSLAGMIARILREPALARSISENARKTARERHNPRKIAAAMMKIYAAIANDAPV